MACGRQDSETNKATSALARRMALSKGQRPASKGTSGHRQRQTAKRVNEIAPAFVSRISNRSGQPFDARCDAPLAHGLRPAYTNEMNALIAEARRMALSKGQRPASKGTCVVYFLRLQSGALYIGASEDLEQRLDDHVSGQACRTTQLDPPIAFLRAETFSTFSEARTREAQLKRWTRAKKEALVSGDLESLHSLSQSRESAKVLNKPI